MMVSMQTDIAGVHLGWPMVLAAVAAAQFVLVALAGAVAPVRTRKALAVSTLVLAAGWFVGFDGRSLLGSKADATTASAAATVVKHEGSCASIQNGMTANDVRKKIGQPDEVRDDQIVRGPGSKVLIYRDMRCAVHVFDERVELVD